ncbi:hypothetical protein ACSBR2_025888 [Camellia fascicularis]
MAAGKTLHIERESFAQRCFTLIDEYAPGFSSSITGYDMLTPPDLERGNWSDRLRKELFLMLLKVGTTDFVMGLPKSLTEKLIQEAL